MVGRGLHTGERCAVTLHPADPNTGIVFISRGKEIPATSSNVHGTHRGTTLRMAGVEIHTVEHLLSALAGMWVDNARVEIEGPELPAGDGSALPFVHMIDRAMLVDQSAMVRYVGVREPVRVGSGEQYMLVSPSDVYRVNASISFPHPLIGEQSVSLVVSPETYRREIAPARTFCTSGEIEAILAQGLGKGGTEDNVIVVNDDDYSVPLRFRDEFVRHKVLDIIGDLSLLGGRLSVEVIGVRSSHSLNTCMAAAIAERAL